MQIKLGLHLKGKSISIKYRELIHGVIYKILSDNSKYSTFLHDIGYLKDGKHFKLFSFSNVIGKVSFKKETKELAFSSDGFIIISCVKEQFINCLFEHFLENDTINIGNTQVKIGKLEILKIDNKTKFKTLSPVIVNLTNNDDSINLKNIYYGPNDIIYNELLINNIKRKYYLIYGKECPNIKIKCIINVRKVISQFKGLIFNAYEYEIEFEKENFTQEVIKVITSCGIGSKNTNGFGLVV